jgi:hypothetical protein
VTIQVWPFKPQMDVVETIEWQTDVQKCKRREERRCLRPFPRVGYRCRYNLLDADYGVARELARVVGGDPVLVPDWPNATQIPTVGAGTVSLPVDASRAPAYRVSGSALVLSSYASYEVVTVTALGTGTISCSATVVARTTPWVVPLRVATFDQEFSGERGPHEYTIARASMTAVDTEDLSAASGGAVFPSYLGDVVITDQVEMINGVTETNTREVDPVDSKTGPLYKYPLYASPNQSAALGWTAQDADALWALRVWLHTRRGRWKRFWTVSWNADVVVTANINPGDSFIQIVDTGSLQKYPNPTDFSIIAKSGAMQFVRTIGTAAGTGGNEYLVLSAPFAGTAITLANIDKTSKLTLSRLDSDRVEIQHLPGRQATVAVATKEVPVYP